MDDSSADQELGRLALLDSGVAAGVTCVDDWSAAKRVLEAGGDVDMILLDYQLPRMNALDALMDLRDREHPPVVIVTGQEDVATAVELLRQGAYDYVTKTPDWDRALCGTVRRVVERVELERGLDKARKAVAAHVASLEREVAVRRGLMESQAEQIERLYLRADEIGRITQQILDNTSHELRTPLHAIIGFSSVLAEELPADAPAELRAMLDAIGANSRQLLGLIESLLDLGALRRGKSGLSISRFSLAGLLRELRGEAEMMNATNGLRLVWSPDPAGPEDVVAHDREKIRTIAHHLLSNAIKFTRTGSVGLTLAPAGGGGVRLVVEDTGIGCLVAARSVMFDDFRQGDGSMTRRFGGLGIGLGIVWRCTTLLGGVVRTDAGPEGGLRISIDLPPVRVAAARWTHPGDGLGTFAAAEPAVEMEGEESAGERDSRRGRTSLPGSDPASA